MRKAKKVRKRGELGFDADEDDGQDRGSRNSERVTKRQRDDQKDKERRNDSYQMALRTETELTNMTIKGQVDIEDVDVDLGSALQRLQKATEREGGSDDGRKLAELVRADELESKEANDQKMNSAHAMASEPC